MRWPLSRVEPVGAHTRCRRADLRGESSDRERCRSPRDKPQRPTAPPHAAHRDPGALGAGHLIAAGRGLTPEQRRLQRLATVNDRRADLGVPRRNGRQLRIDRPSSRYPDRLGIGQVPGDVRVVAAEGVVAYRPDLERMLGPDCDLALDGRARVGIRQAICRHRENGSKARVHGAAAHDPNVETPGLRHHECDANCRPEPRPERWSRPSERPLIRHRRESGTRKSRRGPTT
jgi:hypothetical protein